MSNIMNNNSYDASNDNGNLNLNLHDRSLFTTLAINIWSGSKKLTAKDFGLSNEQLPPGKLASLGSKKIFNPNHIEPFNRMRYEVRNFLTQYSLPFANGFIYPEEYVDTIDSFLEEQKLVFNDKKRLFLEEYEKNLEEWLQEADNVQWRHLISGSIVDAGFVANKFNFGWFTMSFNPAVKSGQLEEAVVNLPASVFADVVESAKLLLMTARKKGNDHTNQKAIPPFERMMEKLNRLRFFNPKAATLSRGIALVINSLPVTGPVTGADYQRLYSLTQSLSSMSGISKLIKKIEDNPDQLLEDTTSFVVQGVLPVEDEDDVADSADDSSSEESADTGIVPVESILSDEAIPVVEPAIEAVHESVGIVPVQEETASEETADTGIVPVECVTSDEVGEAVPATEASVSEAKVEELSFDALLEQELRSPSLVPVLGDTTVVQTEGIIPLDTASIAPLPQQVTLVEDVASMSEQELAGMFNLKVEKTIPRARSFRRPTTPLEM